MSQIKQQSGRTAKNRAQLPASFNHIRWHPLDGMEERTWLMENEKGGVQRGNDIAGWALTRCSPP